MVRHFSDKGAGLNDPFERCDPLGYEGPRYHSSRYGKEPLLDAIRGCRLGCEAVLKLMLERGANPNWYHPNDTPLMAAVQKNRLGLVRMLVEYGAHINYGLPPPITIAVLNENIEIYSYLRKKGAVINTPESGAYARSITM
ncbi:hypothetical protein BGZ60DRAFT_407560 [Tricladium varicosporioides]|nr:hypothetical protein BGZ60DRAFT_407560 [Hymenoscyphus varicosporioides]